ncbi:copper transporter [Ornithinimicrobium cavernae]|uniref:copper transporter n=1 Tax=Ornithinimicrobium cavernae TaxID=2666047 RepID=UPI000D69937A|nr:copper transporter [Ornithinimicrobium cavernae]
MIDFRYHLVSLVAVFMALAVGIVLGAGPLGQEISSTLEAQVKDLREERNALRAQLDQAAAREDLKAQALQILTPTLIDDQLTGRRVALVTLPGADRNIVGQLQEQITSAGGEVLLTSRMGDAWTDPEAAATRHEAAAELAPTLAEPAPREGAEPTVETIIAAALSGSDEETATGAWRSTIERLEELDILTTNWADGQNPQLVAAPDTFVVVTGDLDVQDVEEEETGDPLLQQSLDLVGAFGELDVPTLVAGYGTESYADPVQAAESPIIRGLRAESALAEAVSSVDNVEGPTGQLAAVLGLRWAVDGEPGHWGIGTDSLAPMPEVPEPMTPEVEDPATGPTLPTDPTLPLDPTLPGSDADQGAVPPPVQEDADGSGADAGTDVGDEPPEGTTSPDSTSPDSTSPDSTSPDSTSPDSTSPESTSSDSTPPGTEGATVP